MGFEGFPRNTHKAEEYENSDEILDSSLAESTNAVNEELQRRTAELQLRQAANDTEIVREEGDSGEPSPDLAQIIEQLRDAA